MCGIAGIVDPAAPAARIEALLRPMTHLLEHRGPDDEGYFCEDGIGLGMRRLSIIDLSGGHQPMFNEDGQVAVVYNGEIYNYRELAQQLRRRCHQLRTASDTEVIIHLYEDAGEDCLEGLRGMFAFAIWDKQRQRLFLARDRLGIKPLYYTQAGNCLIFASEIKALLQHPVVVARPDLEAMSNFLSLKYVPAPQTMFSGILALPPGHCLSWDRGTISVRQYWEVSFTRDHRAHQNEADYAEQLEALLQESVKLRLRSDVPFGAFLSGGIDSSLVVALMSKLLQEPVKTFSAGYRGEGEAFSELPFARMVAERYQCDHHEVLVGAQDFVDLAETVIWHMDQPIADMAAIATYMLSRLASQQVKMVLTGEGGDELFAGYARYAGERLAPLFRLLPLAAKQAILATAARVPRLRRPRLALYALCQPDEVSRLTNWFPLFNRDMKAALLSPEVVASLNGASTDDVFAAHLARTDARDPLSRMLYVDTKLWLPDDLLARGDKTSMAASLEARVPLLDHKLVEFAASLPPHMKLRRLARKYLLKKVARRHLPAEIIQRKKQGFPMPFSLWVRGGARNFVRDILSPATIRERGLFQPAQVELLLQQHENGSADHGIQIWALLNIELWYRLFIDGRTHPATNTTIEKAAMLE